MWHDFSSDPQLLLADPNAAPGLRSKGKDLPVGGQLTRLRVEAKRFHCLNEACGKRTFVERLACLPVKAQCTARFSCALQAIAFGLGGQAGYRLATQLRMPTSADTLLRLIRRWSPQQGPTACVVGVVEIDLKLA